VIDKRVAVIGRGIKGVNEARFLRHYTDKLMLFTLGTPHEISELDRASLEESGITVVDEALAEVCTQEGAIVGLQTRSGRMYRFDTLYSRSDAGCDRTLHVCWVLHATRSGKSSSTIGCAPPSQASTPRAMLPTT
jgi:thioredoxin reductase